ncbi:BT_3987 domain-containing protein [Lacibacter sp.]|uniref:BT_3987 domain-containing protein n=1 Tax=Lacibacter sp. TaxID=1915409 RepID=UPI002B4AD450|nr:DUF1735 domain-containing protein [Lacibacter sp.]HLP37709.1 DUF1735 domain-containing protein [Lacibacter sp.]
MKIIYVIAVVCMVSSLASCRKYEPYDTDFGITTSYFSTQKPLRTIVSYDNMQFKVGVAMGGVRENTKDQTVTFAVDPSLLITVAGAGSFTLMPSAYYTLSNSSTITIAKGSFVGDITVTLNRSLFTADVNAVNRYYAIPLRIVSSTTDSVLRGNATVPAKDYTILVVKYISAYSGSYYHKGVEERIDASGNVLETKTYSNADLSKNQVWTLNTVNANTVTTNGAGVSTTGFLQLSLNGTNVTVAAGNAVVSSVSGTGTFNSTSKQFNLDYSFNIGANKFRVKDTLIQRTPPEQDLRFEEW